MNLRGSLGLIDLRVTRSLRRLGHRLAGVVPSDRFRSKPFGVNVIGHSSSAHSLGVVTRSLCAALRSAGVPHDLISIDELSFRRGRSFIDARTGTQTKPRYAFTIITAWPDRRDLRVITPRAFVGRYVIGQWNCEQSELTPAFAAGLDLVDEVWTGSTFATGTFRRSTNKPVSLVPHIVDRPAHRSTIDIRDRFGIPKDRVCFLTIANTASSLQRKNPVGALHAFREAFPQGQSESVLVIKLLTEKGAMSNLRPSPTPLLSEDAMGPDVILIDQELSDEEVTELLRACDCFISLHRAEGFGLGGAEAMTLGKPAIVTNWSGPADYLTPDNSFPVPYELVRIDEHDTTDFVSGLEWAEPDIHAAARSMRSVLDDPANAAALGARAAHDIPTRHSVDVVGPMIAERLHQLHDR